MATAFIASKNDKRKAASITRAVDDGKLPKPPKLHGITNTCDNPKCGAETVLRYYVPGVGYCCGWCFDEWRTTPVWCSTRADDVHIGRVHIIPQCVVDAEAAQNAPVARCSAQGDAYRETAAQVCRKIANSDKQFDAMKESERRWIAERDAAYARRNARLGVKAA